MEKLSTGDIRPLTAEMLCGELKPWQVETAKADFMDYLYDLYDRANASPGLRGTYSGLWERFKSDTAEIVRASHVGGAKV
jgi:hypothetical protein